jgi:phage gp36-like protein
MAINYQPVYTSWEELKSLFPRLDTTSLDAAQVHGTFIAKAEGMINGRLAKKYTVPFSPAPQQVKSMAQDLSFYYIMRRFYTQHAKKDENSWLENYREGVIEELKAINDGSAVIIDNSGSIIDVRTDQQQLWSDVEDYNPTMDNRNEIAQRIDPERIEDEYEDDGLRGNVVILD